MLKTCVKIPINAASMTDAKGFITPLKLSYQTVMTSRLKAQNKIVADQDAINLKENFQAGYVNTSSLRSILDVWYSPWKSDLGARFVCAESLTSHIAIKYSSSRAQVFIA